jgi:S1-C subfamily serine protease
MVRGHDDPVHKNLLVQYAALDKDYRPRPTHLRRNHLSRYEDAIWIVESDETMKQGTGFFLKGYGLVTCHHVVDGGVNYAYHPAAPNIRYRVRVIASDERIDLARLEIDLQPSFEFEAIWLDHPSQGMAVTIAGYPQYAPGMSLWISQGTVSGHRLRVGSPRVVINGLIISGASGSPVLDSYRRVVGVAATGAAYINGSVEDQFHSFIPIPLLKRL